MQPNSCPSSHYPDNPDLTRFHHSVCTVW